jgi:hypothetical protein
MPEVGDEKRSFGVTPVKAEIHGAAIVLPEA